MLIKKYYNNGNIEIEYYILNEKREGFYKEYYSNGNLFFFCNYIDGLIYGYRYVYHPTSEFWMKYNY